MNAQQVWLAQATQAPRVSLEYIRHQASSLERGTRFRAGLNYFICVLACGFYGWSAWTHFSGLPWLQAAVTWYGLFMIYCMYRLHRHVAAQINTADAGVLDTLRFHRRQLERQRDFRRHSWRWQFLAILPGLLLQTIAMAVYSMPSAEGCDSGRGYFAGVRLAVRRGGNPGAPFRARNRRPRFPRRR